MKTKAKCAASDFAMVSAKLSWAEFHSLGSSGYRPGIAEFTFPLLKSLLPIYFVE